MSDRVRNHINLTLSPELGGFVEITPAWGIALDLRYATTNNFLGRCIGGALTRLFLHPIAADKLHRAIDLLGAERPDRQFVIFDGLRPNNVQRVLWDAVNGTAQEPYVADPAVGSIHSYGLAVDVSLLDADGQEIDMGTPFDDFSPLAEPQLEDAHLTAGRLSRAQIDNRRLLRRVMVTAGFQVLPNEWWHFDALPPEKVRARFVRVE